MNKATHLYAEIPKCRDRLKPGTFGIKGSLRFGILPPDARNGQTWVTNGTTLFPLLT